MARRAIGGHQSAAMISDTWLTPPDLLQKLGAFDLDPCCPPVMPWSTASRHITPAEDGLKQPWAGRVWLNPPYSREAQAWMRRMSEHGDGIALVMARTETAWFWETVWRSPTATGVLFLEGRIHFHHPDGRRADANCGAPSVLVAYGWENARVLAGCGVSGQFFTMPLNTRARAAQEQEERGNG
ncbi:DNA N-6-adenine-methyltransferase [Roseomonas elaeocarpi]|uniref:DNA N-6-adenine-methyltransferase n=1 Tax=Roseomonas elaeocarpi TaxID=907779 RepID=A0ABV6JU85_9PROT